MRQGRRGLRFLSAVAAVGLGAAALFARPAALHAQTSPKLVAALRLAQDAKGDSARAVVSRLLQSTVPTDTLYPEILYTQGLIASSLDDMRRSFQRVAVEYGNSRWADQALYRLAQLDYAAKDYAGAARQFDRIRRDYPTSRIIPYGAIYAAEASERARDLPGACQWITEGLARANGDLELTRQLETWQRDHCGAEKLAAAEKAAQQPANADTAKSAPPAAAPAVKAPATVPAKAPAPAPATPAAAYAVQIGAMPTRVAAEALAKRASAAGFTPAIVEEKGYFKVRLGSWATRAEASAGVSAIKAKLGGAPFVVAPSAAPSR